jgi:ribosome-associated toxin RatA of RatAB toxin-antitoxin module
VAEIERSVLVSYTPEEMFTLVETVEDYPKFLPWCGGAHVALRDEGRTRASLLIDYRGLRQQFSTENRNLRPTRIEMRLLEGPFRHLDGQWNFHALGAGACKVEFRLRYEFASRILAALVGPVFENIAVTFVDAFVERARVVYGPR